MNYQTQIDKKYIINIVIRVCQLSHSSNDIEVLSIRLAWKKRHGHGEALKILALLSSWQSDGLDDRSHLQA